MKRSLFALLPLILALGSLANEKDKSNSYQLGTFIESAVVGDGTSSNNIRCGDGSLGTTVCSGGVQANGMTVYRIQAADGVWLLVTERQAADSTARRVFNSQPMHFKAEKPNPLDLLKGGDRLLFRVEKHKKIGGTETDIYIPFADNPDQEAKFVGEFQPAIVPSPPAQPSDNVRAMCDAHKLSPELEKQLCPVPATEVAASSTPVPATEVTASSTPAQAAPSSDLARALQSGAETLAASMGRVQPAHTQLIKKGEASRCSVLTIPPGAEVEVDGKRAGTSPLMFVLLKQGGTPRKVTISLSGYRTVEKTFVPDGKNIPIGLVLEKQ